MATPHRSSGAAAVTPTTMTRLAALPVPERARRATGMQELDRVLSGGFVPGSVTLLGGEPGIGKSTLVLQSVAAMVDAGASALVVCAEESAEQVRARAARLGALPAELWVLPETSLDSIVAAINGLRPDIVVVDSIQTISSADSSGAPGSVSQVTTCAQQLAALARERSLVLVLVGHVTKDGAIAGPRVLEHLVDTVLSFEGDRDRHLRMLRALKHRHGPTGELGLFEMTSEGLVGVADAGHLFLAERRESVSGSVVVATVEGRRPLLVEVQSLVGSSDTTLPMARRSAQGLDSGRLGLLLAVLERHADIRLVRRDVWALAAGGARVTEPAADLALALAVASAFTDKSVPDDVVVCGEVGLGGEVRPVERMAQRLAEAARLGFRRAVVPGTGSSFAAVGGTDGLEILPVTSLRAATDLLGLRPGRQTA